MANSLMFEVGVKEAGTQLTDLEKRLKNIVSTYGKLELKVQVDGLKAFTSALENIGQSKGLDALQKRIDVLQVTLANVGMAGSKSIQEFEAALKTTSAVADQYRRRIEDMENRLAGIREKHPRDYANQGLYINLSNRLDDLKNDKQVLAIYAQEQVAIKNLEDAKIRLNNTNAQEAESYKKVISSIETLSNAANTLKTALGSWDASKGSIAQLIEQFEKLHKEIAETAAVMKGIDPSKLNLSGLNINIGNIAGLGDLNSAIRGLEVSINEIIRLFSNLTNAVKLQPVDEQVKALLERCERAETKLREVGDAARYLNERAGAKTQQKAGTIMDITGTEAEQINKVSSTAERFLRLLVEIENQMAKIGKIQVFGEQSGFSPTLLKNAQNQLEALKKIVESTIKGTPIAEGLIIPASNSQLAQFIQQFGLLKAQYRDIITEADRFNKAQERLAKQNEKKDENFAKQLANDTERATKKVAELQVKVEQYKDTVSKAQLVNAPTGQLQQYINYLQAIINKLNEIRANKGLTNTNQTLKEILNGSFGAKMVKGNYEERLVKDIIREMTKYQGKNFNPVMDALNEYKKVVNEITALQKTGKTAEKFGIDITDINNKIAALERYRQELEQIAAGRGQRTAAELRLDKDYQNAVAAGNAANAIAKNTIEKQNNAHATQQLSDSEQRLANAVKSTSDSMRGQSQVLSDLKMMAMQYLSVWGAQSFVSSIIETGGQLEQQRLSLSAILGDMGKAQTLFNQIKVMALKSPFGVVELDKMTKQLAAYSFEYEELFDWTKRLADISAATGTSVDRLALALGHVRSEGALSGYTLRQFAMANVPVLRMLSENLGVSSKEVRERVKKKEISAEDVQDILKQLTQDGGMFANAQETMSEALNAKFKNLRDAFDIMYGEIAESGIGDKLKDLAVVLTNGAKHWERLATDVRDVAIAFGIGKVAMLVYNNALGKGTALTLKSALAAKQKEIANLELTASYRQLSTAELRTMANAGKLNATNIATLLNTKKLTYAELERAVALGKVDKATAMSALRMQGMYKQMALLRSVAPLQGFARIWAVVAYNIKLASAAIKSFLASAWPLLALTAVFELWNRRSEQKDNANDMAKSMAGNARGREAYEMRDTLADSRKLSNEALKQNIEEMQKALVAADAYTAELKEQVAATDDLTKKYDLLKVKIGEVADAYEDEKAVQEKMLSDAWNAGGGEWYDPSSYFRDNMLEDTKQFDVAMAEFQKKLTIASKQIKGVLSEWLQNQGLYEEAYANMTGKQIFESLGKDTQTSFLNYAWNAKGIDAATSEILRQVSRAYGEVDDKLSEMRSKQGEEFSTTIKSMYEEAYHVDLDKASDEQKIAFDKWLRETLSRAEGLSKEAKEALRNIVIDFTIKLVPHYQVEKQETAADVIEQQIGDNKWLSGFFSRQNGGTPTTWTVEQAQKEVKKYNKLFGDISLSNLDTAPKKINSLLDGLEETKKNIQNTLSKGLLSDTEKEDLNKSLKDTTDSIDLAEKALKDVGGKRQRKGDKKSGSTEDKDAKDLRERMRILKEAADAYKYWRDKVGEGGAEAHINDEFGDVLAELGYKFRDVQELRKTIKTEIAKYQEIYDKSGKKRPQLLEAIKEGYKTEAGLKRNDFERDTERFLSKTQIELDNLTRSWETFNSVREATGSIELAVQLSGAQYAEGQTRNLADSVREKIERDFAAAGAVTIPFDINLSDEQIQRQVEEAFHKMKPVQMEGESKEDYQKRLSDYESKIKGITEETKKWRDLQRDVYQRDIQNYAKVLGGLKDYHTQLQQINDEYNQMIESLDNLLKKGDISVVQYTQAQRAAEAKRDSKQWHLEGAYGNLYANFMGMAQEAFTTAYEKEIEDLNNLFDTGAIDAEEFANKINKLNEMQREFSTQGFFGIKGGVGSFLSGGWQGMKGYYQQRMNASYINMVDARKKYGTESAQYADAEKEYQYNKDKYESMEKQEKAAESLVFAFQQLANGANLLSDLFKNMGFESGSNAMSDAGGLLSSALGGASSLSALGPWGMAAGAGIGLVSGIFALYDKQIQRQIDALKENAAALQENTDAIKTARERTLGYDYTGELRKRMAQQYDYTAVQHKHFDSGISEFDYDVPDWSQIAMMNYYSKNFNRSGYQAELENLKEQRALYMEMYNLENSKKNQSDEALREYREKIADLDDQILFFVEDFTRELWGIDFKSWADQISDALWTAFENGEDALDAFHDAAKDIIADVAKRMMNIHLIEPVFSQLEDALFGPIGSNGQRSGGVAYNAVTGQFNEDETLRILGKFFGEDGEFAKVISSAESFYRMAEQATGFDLSSDDTSRSTASGIKGITEQTADLLAGYLNATRASTANIENLSAQYFPLFYQTVTSSNRSLVNIESNTAAIMRSNQIVADRITSLDSSINGLKNKTWKVPVA